VLLSLSTLPFFFFLFLFFLDLSNERAEAGIESVAAAAAGRLKKKQNSMDGWMGWVRVGSKEKKGKFGLLPFYR
jgi:hypothetical protein